MQILVLQGNPAALEADGLLSFSSLRTIVENHTPKRWLLPDDDALQPLLNTLRLVQVTAPLPATPKHTPLERVKAALKTLLADLPSMVEVVTAEQERAAKTGEQTFLNRGQAGAIVDLHKAALAAHGSFFWRSKKPVRSEPWHQVAHAIAWHSRTIWHTNKPGAGLKPTSPVIALIEELLPLVGCGTRTRDAIVGGIVKSRKATKAARSDKSVSAIVRPTTH